jgi:hypothetical protein
MPSTPQISPLPTDAAVALQRGNKIEAIKIVRRASGLGLKEAKDLVEANLSAEPSLQAAYSAAQSQGGGRGLVLWLAVVLAAGWLAYLFLSKQ